MRTELDCMVCLFQQALATARLCTHDPVVHHQVVAETGKLLSKLDVSLSPPENAVSVYKLIAALTGEQDPFAQVKSESNALARQVCGQVRERINSAENSLYAAVRFAIAGNIIDYGTRHEFDALGALEQCLEGVLKIDDFKQLQDEVIGSENLNILYLADNCGEIVFDGLLVEQLQRLGHRITLVVRSEKILNDVTLESAKEAGVDSICRIIQNGTSCPGTPLASCSDELQQAYAGADVIISKGQGNFETLSEVAGPIYFLLTVKCAVVARHICELKNLPEGVLKGNGEMVLMKREECNACETD